MTYLDPTRLLSVQSHVVSGYVGNRAATFPLQLLGYDVDVVNTVQFSNHTGYGHTNGHKTTAEQIDLVFQGLETNGLCRWSRCLTGYIPGAEAVEAVGKEIRSLKSRAEAKGEQVLYLLDPVMGDIGKGLYVAQDVVPVYRSLLPLASIITPNQFETELLSETKITDFLTLHKALKVIHQEPYGVKHVVISSIPLPRGMVRRMRLPGFPERYCRLRGDEGEGLGEGDDSDEVLVCFASTSAMTETSTSSSTTTTTTTTTTSNRSAPIETYAYALPTIRGYYSGVGDLFSALVLGCFKRGGSSSNSGAGSGSDLDLERQVQRENEELDRAVGRALWGVQVVLLKTHQGTLGFGQRSGGGSGSGKDGGDMNDNNEAGDGTMTMTTTTPSCIPSDEELDAESTPTTTRTKTTDGPDGPADGPTGPSRRAQRMRLRELKVVQEREVLGRLGGVSVGEGVGVGGGEGGEERWMGKRLDWDELLLGE